MYRASPAAAVLSWSSVQRVQREVAVLHRQIVFQLVVLERRAALTGDVCDFGGARRPDALGLYEIPIVDHPNQALLVVRFHLDDSVVILLHPQVSVGILR